ncbi:MAG: hypothetical protein HYX90_02235, partial [Chloroflexi bacterium]|nr:hypothetical protein [Chloroflexota bacterium]
PTPTAKPSPATTPSGPTPTTKPTTTATVSPTATSAPVSFAGKTVTIVIPYAPGGGNDLTARLYARYLPKYLPGSPSVIVRNMPGGNATVGSNFVYSEVKPDGLTALGAASSVFLAYLTGMSAVKYDLQKMEPIIAAPSGGVYYVKPGILSKPQDLPTSKGIVFGNTAGAFPWLFVTASKLINFKPDKVVSAFGSTGEARRAFLSGEINSTADTGSGYWQNVDAAVKKGEIQLLFQTGIPGPNGTVIRDPGLPADILTGGELYQQIYNKAPSGMAWDAYKAVVAAGFSYGKSLLLPPGTPGPIVKAWRDAGDRMFKDPEFKKAAEVLLGTGASLASGDSFPADFRATIKMDAKVLEYLVSILKEHGMVLE